MQTSLSLLLLGTILSTTLVGCSGSKDTALAAPKPDSVFTKERVRTTLPDLKDERFASDDRRMIQALMERADKEKKTLILDLTAAWCGPCQAFAKDFADHPDSAKELADMNVILAKSEYEKYPTGLPGALNDYLPMPAKFFPSFHAYVPGKGWKLLGPSSTVKGLKDDIALLVPAPFLSIADLKAYAETTAKNQQTGSSDKVPNAAAALMSIYGVTSIYTYGEVRDLIRTYQSLAQRYPKSYSQYQVSTLKRALLDYVGAGAVSIDGLYQDFPDVGVHVRDLSDKQFTIGPFAYALAERMHNEGLKAASDQCDQSWTEYKKALVPGTLSGAAYQKIVAETESRASELCADLDLRANGLSEALKSKFEKLQKGLLANWLLVAKLDHVDDAIAIFDKRYKTFVDSYDKYEKSLQEELQKAKDKQDEKEIKQVTESIEETKFQRAYHDGVAVTVRNDLRAKLAIPTITVFN